MAIQFKEDSAAGRTTTRPRRAVDGQVAPARATGSRNAAGAPAATAKPVRARQAQAKRATKPVAKTAVKPVAKTAVKPASQPRRHPVALEAPGPAPAVEMPEAAVQRQPAFDAHTAAGTAQQRRRRFARFFSWMSPARDSQGSARSAA